MFDDEDEWKDCKVELKHFRMNHCVKTKSYERIITHENDDCEHSAKHADTDEDDSVQDSDEDARCGFQ